MISPVKGGGTPKSDMSNWDGEVPFVTPVELNGRDGGPVTTWSRSLTDRGAEVGSSTIPAGVLVSCRAPVGHVGTVTETVAFNQGCKGMVMSDEWDARFLAYCMVAARRPMNLLANGTTFLEISGRAMGSIRVPWPAAEERARVADYLDAETAQIDGMIAELDELVRILDVRRVEAVAQAVHLAEDDAELPAGWVRMPMKYAVLESFTGEWGDDAGAGEVDVPCVRVADFNRATRTVGQDEIPTIRSLPASKASAKALRPNDLLVERSGGTAVNPVGNVVLYVGPEGAVSSNFIECVRVDEAHHDPRYWWLLQYAAYRTGFTHTHVRQTTGIQNLDARGFFSEPMPVPGLSEQRRVVAEVEASMARVDAMLADARRLKNLLIERRAALITDVITGKKEAA
ncbi:restriction endonuclease subunit S [Micrococcus luteus]|uniref:restriction endonuclease subunit S n=1 Tax=Micrococcus luteus TaxID=1270 RepID=UPI00352F5B43